MWSDKCKRIQPIYCSHLRSEWKKIGQYVTNMAGKDRCAQQTQLWIASFVGRGMPGVPEAPSLSFVELKGMFPAFPTLQTRIQTHRCGVLHPKEEMIHTTKPPAIEGGNYDTELIEESFPINLLMHQATGLANI